MVKTRCFSLVSVLWFYIDRDMWKWFKKTSVFSGRRKCTILGRILKRTEGEALTVREGALVSGAQSAVLRLLTDAGDREVCPTSDKFKVGILVSQAELVALGHLSKVCGEWYGQRVVTWLFSVLCLCAYVSLRWRPSSSLPMSCYLSPCFPHRPLLGWAEMPDSWDSGKDSELGQEKAEYI